MTQGPVVPNPGSPVAIDNGCRCPVLDNGHGSGHGTMWDEEMGKHKQVFVMNADCPMHGQAVNYDWAGVDA